VALVVVPLSVGALIGIALRHLHRRRFAGVGAATIFVVMPAWLAVRLVLHFPLVGYWDALLEGLLIGIGVAWTAHGTFTGRSEVLLAVGSLAVSLVVLEICCRVFLPPPPSFPTEGGAHFLLADAMRADTQNHSWDLLSKEIVCSIVYGAQYPGILDVSGERDIVVPRGFTPRAGASRRVLHIGDSMTFGFGVARNETFTADLERLEPGTQHINGGIPGTAPDAYLVVLRQWVALHDVDLAVMYIFEGNDVDALDDYYPCCHWQSLLTYGPAGVALRCPTAGGIDLSGAGTTWLRYNGPPPYLVRVLIPYSSAAAYLGAAIVSWMPLAPIAVQQSQETKLLHLESILRAARDELRARHVSFVVVILPSGTWDEDPATAQHLAPQILEIARRLNVPAFNALDAVRDEAKRGRQIFLAPGDPHYNAAGHALIAQWLHDRLAATTVLPPP
jgi:hypothetical protein